MPYRLLPILLLCACGAGPVDAKPKKEAWRMPVLVSEAVSRPLAAEIRAGGTLEPAEVVQITARVAGVVERVAFREGDVVKPGQVLAEIDPERFRIASERARAELAKAEAGRDEAVAALKRREGTGLVPDDELATWRSRLAQADAAVALARAGLAQAELDARDATVRAVVEAPVATRGISTGQFVPVGAVVATQVRRLPLIARARVTTADAGRLTAGMSLHIQVGAGQPLTGRLIQVGATTDATRMVEIVAAVDEAPPTVVAGGYAELIIPVGGSAPVVVASANALRTSERGSLVFVVEGSGEAAVARQRTVTLGLRTADGQVEIRSGIAAGDRLVVRGADQLRDGQAVVVQER